MAFLARRALTVDPQSGTTTDDSYDYFASGPSSGTAQSSSVDEATNTYVSSLDSSGVYSDSRGIQHFTPDNYSYPNEAGGNYFLQTEPGKPWQLTAESQDWEGYDLNVGGQLAGLIGPLTRKSLNTPLQHGNEVVSNTSYDQNGKNPLQINVSIDWALGEKQATLGSPQYYRNEYAKYNLAKNGFNPQSTIDFYVNKYGIDQLSKIANSPSNYSDTSGQLDNRLRDAATAQLARYGGFESRSDRFNARTGAYERIDNTYSLDRQGNASASSTNWLLSGMGSSDEYYNGKKASTTPSGGVVERNGWATPYTKGTQPGRLENLNKYERWLYDGSGTSISSTRSFSASNSGWTTYSAGRPLYQY